jgi:hypothetical protein
VGCPKCGGSNSASFNFCQWCGWARRLIKDRESPKIVINEDEIRLRKDALSAITEEKKHFKKKCKEFEDLEVFLHSRGTVGKLRGSVLQAMPGDIVDFLIHRDLQAQGRTVVHTQICLTRNLDGSCGCPTRLAADSVRGLASKIRTRFYELGCGGQWRADCCSGNPADSTQVDQYVKSIKEEQAQAGCQVMMARQRAMLPQKLNFLILAMAKEADKQRSICTEKCLQILQDMAWLTIQFRAVNRGAEISNLKVGNTLVGPNDSCLILQFTFSKVMREGKAHEFAVASRPGDPTCPVRRIRMYVDMTKKQKGWDWEQCGKFVFQDLKSDSPKPVTAAAMNERLKTHLKFHNMDEGEILHGLRAGGALTMALEGKSIEDIMAQGFWASPQSAMKYVGILSEVIGKEFLEEVRRRHGDLLNKLTEKAMHGMPLLGDK